MIKESTLSSIRKQIRADELVNSTPFIKSGRVEYIDFPVNPDTGVKEKRIIHFIFDCIEKNTDMEVTLNIAEEKRKGDIQYILTIGYSIPNYIESKVDGRITTTFVDAAYIEVVKDGGKAKLYIDTLKPQITFFVGKFEQIFIEINYLLEHPEVKVIKKEGPKEKANVTNQIPNKAKDTVPKNKDVKEHKPRKISINGIKIIVENENVVKKLKSRKKITFSGWWTVRGHYRHYKTGKTVYIKPYEKGHKDGKKQIKEYQIKEKNNGK